MTIWVWPESLWAPISFTMAYLEQIGHNTEEWKDYWCSKDAQVYQFIGADNIYFYGVAEMGMFMALQGKDNLTTHPADGQMQLPILVANKPHSLPGQKSEQLRLGKASNGKRPAWTIRTQNSCGCTILG